MQNRLNLSASSRMRPDLEAAIEYLPGLASLALWCNFADTDEAVIAYTDGSTIFAGVDYENFSPKERRFVCLHEILHIALCHPTRFVELENRDSVSFEAELLNIAADAIINSAMEKLTGLEVPREAWTLANLWQCLEKSEDTKSKSESSNNNSHYFSFSAVASQNTRKIANLTRTEFTAVNRWSCEELYYFLKERCQAADGFDEILAGFNEKYTLSGDLRAKGSGACKTGSVNDLQVAERTVNDEKRNWQQRLGLLRGTVPELLDRLAGELPRVETPWEQIFRSLVQTVFQESVRNNYSRPNRRWLALESDYNAQTGISLPFAPDVFRKRGTRLAAALDTSGSIDNELLRRFLAEIAALCAFNQRNLVLIIGDAAVHQTLEINWREVSDELARIKYTGGGGTDFRPLIEAAAQFQPDALVYLTDLYGEAGDEPDFPVIWATHGVSGNAPWGEQVKLK